MGRAQSDRLLKEAPADGCDRMCLMEPRTDASSRSCAPFTGQSDWARRLQPRAAVGRRPPRRNRRTVDSRPLVQWLIISSTTMIKSGAPFRRRPFPPRSRCQPTWALP